MDSTPIIQLSAPKGELLEPPPSLHPILTNGYELRPAFIAMVREQSFSGVANWDFQTRNSDPFAPL
jgi:hypothetical protein